MTKCVLTIALLSQAVCCSEVCLTCIIFVVSVCFDAVVLCASVMIVIFVNRDSRSVILKRSFIFYIFL